MANPESFLEEVAEEVRRDRLFRFFKKYGWLFIIVILLAICASIFWEWNKNSSTLKARNNGDLLAEAVKESENGDLTKLEGLLSKESLFVGPSSDLVAVTKILYAEYLFEITGDSNEAMSLLQEVTSSRDFSEELRQLARLKHMFFALNNEPDGYEYLDQLAAPNNYFRSLVEEQRIQLHISDNEIDKAISKINVLTEDPEVTQVQKRRLMDLKAAIR